MMDRVEFGVTLPSAKGIAEFAQCRGARLRLPRLRRAHDVLWPDRNSLIGLSVAAGVTTKIRLMSSVVLLPLYNPMVLAKQTSVLDVASGGRYHMGIGIGGEFPKEFEACGVPVKERGSRANEALEVITKVWTEQSVSFEGRYSRFTGVTLAPPPAQKPLPPIWVAGRKEPAMRRAAKYGDGWLPYMYTPEMVHESVGKIREFRRELGREGNDVRTGLYIFGSISANREDAIDQAAQTLGRTTRRIFRVSRRSTRCPARRKTAANESGSTSMPAFGPCVISWVCEAEDVPANVRLFAEEVAPEFR